MRVTANLNLSKSRPEGAMVAVHIENPLNIDRRVGSNGVVTSPVFGLPNRALDKRRFELVLRYGF